MNKYCPYQGCAALITYASIQPEKCPKCHRVLADAFKVAVESVISTSPKPKQTTTTARRVTQPTTLMRPTNQAPIPLGDESEANLNDVVELDENEVDESYNPHEVHRTARELAASIDPSTIHIAGEDDDEPVKFGDWVAGPKR